MKREFRTLIALSLLTISTAALPAIASDTEMLRVTVPFAFTAGAISLPAGDYVVWQQVYNHVLTIEGKGGSAVLVTVPQESANDLKASNLTFEKTLQGNTLLGVQVSGRQSLIMNHTAAVTK